jgi:hypothetical protein
MFFGHVIKAQPHRCRPALKHAIHGAYSTYSMKMLDVMLQQNIRFIDYEAIRARSPGGRCRRFALVLSCIHSLCSTVRATV